MIIECIREPISREISAIFQEIMMNRIVIPEKNKFNTVIEKLHHQTNYSLKFISTDWKKYCKISILQEFDPDKKYFYQELDNAKLLFIRFNEINKRTKLFKKLGYNYKPNHSNKTDMLDSLGDLNKKIKKELKFSKEQLDNIYNTSTIKAFYTDEEINYFKNNFIIKDKSN